MLDNPHRITYGPAAEAAGSRGLAAAVARAVLAAARAKERRSARASAAIVTETPGWRAGGPSVEVSIHPIAPHTIDGATWLYPVFGPSQARWRPLPIGASWYAERLRRRIAQDTADEWVDHRAELAAQDAMRTFRTRGER